MTGDAELAGHKALEFMLLIRSGLFDAQLGEVLTAVTDRMSSPEYHRRPPPGPAPPTDWPIGGWFDDPHAG